MNIPDEPKPKKATKPKKKKSHAGDFVKGQAPNETSFQLGNPSGNKKKGHVHHAQAQKLYQRILKWDRDAGDPLARTDPIKYLAKALGCGIPIPIACQAIGITPMTFHEWKTEVAEGTSHRVEILRQFFEELEVLRAQSMVRHLQLLDSHGQEPKFWMAISWILERTNQGVFAIQRSPTVVVDQRKSVAEIALVTAREAATSYLPAPEGPPPSAIPIEFSVTSKEAEPEAPTT